MTDATILDGILDPRPDRDTITFQMLRLGLQYEGLTDGNEVWSNYGIGVVAAFPHEDPKIVTVTDVDIKESFHIPIERIPEIRRIKTWRSDGSEMLGDR